MSTQTRLSPNVAADLLQRSIYHWRTLVGVTAEREGDETILSVMLTTIDARIRAQIPAEFRGYRVRPRTLPGRGRR